MNTIMVKKNLDTSNEEFGAYQMITPVKIFPIDE